MDKKKVETYQGKAKVGFPQEKVDSPQETLPKKEYRLVGQTNTTQVICLDEPSEIGGGACHEYIVVQREGMLEEERGEVYAYVSIQNGPLREVEPNGCHNEDLVDILIDRMEHFQNGPFPCVANAIVLGLLRAVKRMIGRRNTDRKERGVKGLNKA